VRLEAVDLRETPLRVHVLGDARDDAAQQRQVRRGVLRRWLSCLFFAGPRSLGPHFWIFALFRQGKDVYGTYAQRDSFTNNRSLTR
jgi:hypothetical protein